MDRQVGIGSDHIDVVRGYPHPIIDQRDRHSRARAQDMRHLALALRVEMQHDDKGAITVGWQGIEKTASASIPPADAPMPTIGMVEALAVSFSLAISLALVSAREAFPSAFDRGGGVWLFLEVVLPCAVLLFSSVVFRTPALGDVGSHPLTGSSGCLLHGTDRMFELLRLPQIVVGLEVDQKRAVLTPAISSRTVRSGLIPALPFSTRDRAARDMDNRSAASVTGNFSGLKTISLKISPGWGWLCIMVASSMVILIIDQIDIVLNKTDSQTA